MRGEGSDPGNEDLEYCRSIETYLCRKNDGHLIRIVGPSFEVVSSWAGLGVPLKVAFRGIDRYFERYYSKNSRRRPVRVEFCSADVLDVFDEWRRAVGIANVGLDDGAGGDPAAASDSQSQRKSLPAHLARALMRLTSVEARVEGPFRDAVGSMIDRLETLRVSAKGARGQAREAVIQQLTEFDRDLLEAARLATDPVTAAELKAEADAELTRFKGRMPPEAFDRARAACYDRLVRERAGLPTLSLD